MIILGHRGGRGEGWPPENTLESFARAFEEGAAGIELDVRVCASGEPILLHDTSLTRVSNGAEKRGVHLVRREELPLLGGGGEGGVRIPTLGEALDLCAERGKIVNVEVKADARRRVALIRAVAKEIKRARSGIGEIVISSFDPAIVIAFAAAAPKIPRGMLVGPRTPRLATALPLAVRRAVTGAHLEDALVTQERVDRMHRAGLRVVTWTVNDVARANAMRAMGVDWLITDQPAQIIRGL